MYIKTIVNLTSRAWSLRILSLLHQGVAGRQAALLSASGAGRTAFLQSLEHLITQGWVEKNPGHGHPLRPEYRLTKQGKAIAALSYQIDQSVSQPAEHELLRRNWTIPILSISHEPLYFSDLKNHLSPITDRALSQSLKNLHEEKWLTRKVDVQSYPLRPIYQAANTGLVISELCRLS